MLLRIFCTFIIFQIFVSIKLSAQEISFEIEDVENLGRYKKLLTFQKQ